MMPGHTKNAGLLALALALGLTVALYWLASDYRPDGVLGELQRATQPLCFLPYLIGALLSSSPHSPNSIAFAIGLLGELYFPCRLLVFAAQRIHANTA